MSKNGRRLLTAHRCQQPTERCLEMARNPRVSRSLRAFSGVGIQLNVLTDIELAEELIYKRRKRSELQSFTWQEFKKVVDEKSTEKDRKAVILYLNSSTFF